MRRLSIVLACVVFILLIMLALFSLAIYIAGCAVRPMKVTIPRECIKQVELSDHAKCIEQKDGSLSCTGLLLTFYKGCSVVKIDKRRM
jgi:hypothetical protein